MSAVFSLAFSALTFWLIWRLLRTVWRWVAGGTSNALDKLKYRLGDANDWAIALARPMAVHSISGGFDAGEVETFTDELKGHVRLSVLLQLGLPSHLNDDQVRRELQQHLARRWYCLDINELRATDDWRDGMAFACMRVAFSLRCALFLGWIDEATQWRLLRLNALRAQECFDSWHDYGCAAARGRRQWIAQSRTDNLGTAFTEQQVTQWLSEGVHPWRGMPWKLDLQVAGR
ncbi:DUF1266 domain-containing protein [Ottowia testudinis]|uniref:DUF1266 domain-containing protein n=1 Tax=Ottowia testudinis TaxID=2816950 RepID=A0A975CIY5_9BURK|nr:DUF1266 domain-containing protein [Ottowia testudinis]QTD44263.1 DUF1266 domain-containing protein [Ottowia testudinis]